MADKSVNLGLPYIQVGQAGKEITHAEGVTRLDAVVQLSVLSRALGAPPAAPGEGQRWIVAAAASGAWAGRAGQVAAFYQGWKFFAPQPGWLAWCTDEGQLLVWTGSEWRAGQSYTRLRDLLDVDGAAAPADGASLHWDAPAAKWKPSNSKQHLGDLAGVDTTGAEPGDALVLGTDGTWRPGEAAGGGVDIGDAVPLDGDFLVWAATAQKWSPRRPRLSDIVDVDFVAEPVLGAPVGIVGGRLQRVNIAGAGAGASGYQRVRTPPTLAKLAFDYGVNNPFEVADGGGTKRQLLNTMTDEADGVSFSPVAIVNREYGTGRFCFISAQSILRWRLCVRRPQLRISRRRFALALHDSVSGKLVMLSAADGVSAGVIADARFSVEQWSSSLSNAVTTEATLDPMSRTDVFWMEINLTADALTWSVSADGLDHGWTVLRSSPRASSYVPSPTGVGIFGSDYNGTGNVASWTILSSERA